LLRGGCGSSTAASGSCSGSIILCLRAYIAYYLERQEYLNQRDARIISKYANAVLEGT
jgi:hypothetical protein